MVFSVEKWGPEEPLGFVPRTAQRRARKLPTRRVNPGDGPRSAAPALAEPAVDRGVHRASENSVVTS